jgi:hypothetical protein
MQKVCQILLFMPALAALAGCGLPTVAYLYPPVLDVESAILTIRNNPNNYEASEGDDQTFLGIEIYYRVYQLQSGAETALAGLRSLADQYEDKPSQFDSIVRSSGYGFRPLKREDYGTPLVAIDSNDTKKYYLRITGLSYPWHLVDDLGTPIVRILRNLDGSGTASSLYFEAGEFLSGDPDYSGTGSPSATSTVYIVFFAMSYGQDVASGTVGQTVFSDPYIPTGYATYSPTG